MKPYYREDPGCRKVNSSRDKNGNHWTNHKNILTGTTNACPPQLVLLGHVTIVRATAYPANQSNKLTCLFVGNAC